MKIRRRIGLAAAATALALGGMLVAVAPANAAPALSGYGYDGTDPGTTGCAADARVIYQHALTTPSGATTSGQMQVEYSPSCGTNWVRSYWPSAADMQVKSIVRSADSFGTVSTDYYAGWTYTDQLYAPGCVDGVVSIGAQPLPGATPIASWSVHIC